MIVPVGLLRTLSGKHSRRPDLRPGHGALRTAGDGRRHGSGAAAGLRSQGRERPESRLRHRVVHPRHGHFCGSSRCKGRVTGAKTVTITKNEILTGLNKPDEFYLAICLIDGDRVDVRYVRQPFEKEPDFQATSVNYDLVMLLAQAQEPA